MLCQHSHLNKSEIASILVHFLGIFSFLHICSLIIEITYSHCGKCRTLQQNLNDYHLTRWKQRVLNFWAISFQSFSFPDFLPFLPSFSLAPHPRPFSFLSFCDCFVQIRSQSLIFTFLVLLPITAYVISKVIEILRWTNTSQSGEGQFCPPGDIPQCLRHFSCLSHCGKCRTLQQNLNEGGLLLNTLQCTGRFPTTNKYLIPTVNKVYC